MLEQIGTLYEAVMGMALDVARSPFDLALQLHQKDQGESSPR